MLKIARPKSLQHFAHAVACLLLFLIVAGPSLAQIPALPIPKGDAKPETSTPEPDPYGRETPRSMQAGLARAMAASDFARVAQYLDLGKVSDEEGIRYARSFKAALDKHGHLDTFLMISDKPEGRIDDSLPPDQERLGEFDIDGRKVDIIMKRADQPEGPAIWRISRETVRAVPKTDEPPDGTAINVGGAPLMDWGRLLGLAVGMAFAVWLVLFVLFSGLSKLTRHHRPHPVARFLKVIAPPLVFVLAASLFLELVETIEAGIIVRGVVRRLAGAVGWVALIWFVARLSRWFAEVTMEMLRRRKQGRVAELIDFVQRMASVTLFVAGVAVVLATLGVNVSAGLAALGLGGIAIALGARKAIENLIGSVSVIIDQPVSVGDTCRYNGIIGEVIEIGMRSTRIRTADRTVLVVPNSLLSDGAVENLSARDSIFVYQLFHVSFEAGAEGIETALQVVRDCLKANPAHIPKVAAARFIGFSDAGHKIEIHTRLQCENFLHGLELQEELLLTIVKRLEERGITLDLPRHVVWHPSETPEA